MAKKLTRRSFLKGSAAAAVALQLKKPFHTHNPNYTLAASKLNVAAIGAGGKGDSDINACADENIVALADVDSKRAAKAFAEFEKADKYANFRDMLDKHPEIDAVTISTPDHFHAYAADYAMRMGKHVYVQKPLTYSIGEARHLTLTARETGAITQMGNQGHAGDGVRTMCEDIWSGMIGDVTEVHIWTNRPVWPQGIAAPTEAQDVPETLDWNLWQGVTEHRPYNSAYLPFSWRGWWEYGAGALGDMACHIADAPNWALNLSQVGPTSVELISVEGNNDESFPTKSVIKYEFPARVNPAQPPVTIFWYDGGNLPPHPKDLAADVKLGEGDNGSLFVGTEGYATCDTYAGNPRLLPRDKFRGANRHAEKSLERVSLPGKDNWKSSQVEWLNAIKNGTQPGSNFEYSGPFTEWVVMGNLSLRFPGQKLEWDAKNMKVTNNDAANEFVMRDFKNGLSLGKLGSYKKA
ncbi:MAG: Gfo/Idh/MocA family oxidoreductase [Candidatus Hydrogenedentota bacterium]